MKNLYIILIGLAMINSAAAQWEPQSSGVTMNLNSVYFTDALTGYAVGDSGIILGTTDGGLNWIIHPAGFSVNLNSVYFTDLNTGYAAGDSGTILKTTNSGTNWTKLNSGISKLLYSIHFPDTSTGYAVGTDRTILKTTNGGADWTFMSASYGTYLTSVFFTTQDTGFIAGRSFESIPFVATNYILKTTNGGSQWTISFDEWCPWTIGPGSCTVYFTNTDTGYAVGFCGNSVLKTTDGGGTWTNQISVSSGSLHYVHFPDPNVGFTVGWDGEIIRTLNSGTTWDFLTSGTSNQLNSVFFINEDTGYVAGNNGTILKTTNGGGTPVGTNHNPNANVLRIYPNPTNGIFTLETSLSGHLTLMDLKGLIIREEDVIGGKSSIDIRPLTSGVYILKLSYEGTTAIRKVVKW